MINDMVLIFNNHAKVDIFIEITRNKENISYMAINFYSNSGLQRHW